MLEVFQITNSELSEISALLGLASLICYFPGGWLADRAQSRTLLTLSCLLTGIGGIYMGLIARGVMSDFGSNYHQLIALHMFWSITTILTYWAALIKATQAWGGESQGAAFGLLDSGRGLIKVLLTTASIWVFGRSAQASVGLSDAILIHAVACLVAGLACWLWIPREELSSNSPTPQSAEPTHQDFGTQSSGTDGALNDLITLSKLPTIWLMGLIIFTAYSAYWSTFSFARYAEEVYQFEEQHAKYVSTISMWVRSVMPFAAGFLADRFGKSRVVSVSFFVCALAFSVFSLVQGSAELMWILLATVTLVAIGIFALRGVYFALLKGTEIPERLSGLAVGVISLIGFTPDIFIPLYQDFLRGAFTSAGGVVNSQHYQAFYATLMALSLVGLGATWILTQRTKRLSGERLMT